MTNKRMLSTFLQTGFMFLLAFMSFSAASAQEVPTQNCFIATDAWVVYEVQSGDTLESIAQRTDATIAQIAEVNCLSNARYITVGQRIWVPRTPDARPESENILQRCREAGLTAQQCRRLLNANDDPTRLERCLAAGLSQERCRWILYGDENQFAERCLNAGFTEQECRRIWNANNGAGDLAERCRNTGFTEEQCRRLYNAAQDDTDPNPPDTRPATNDTGNVRPAEHPANPNPEQPANQHGQPNTNTGGNR